MLKSINISSIGILGTYYKSLVWDTWKGVNDLFKNLSSNKASGAGNIYVKMLKLITH